MTSTAHFVTSAVNTDEVAQTIVFTVGGKTRVYHRVSNGQRGRGNAWKVATIADTDITSTNVWTASFALSNNDEALVLAESITPIYVKHLKERQLTKSDMTHGEAVADFVELAKADLSVSYATQAATPVVTPVVAQAATPVPAMSMELASVPDIKWAKDYINRKVVGNLTEFDIYDCALANGDNVLVEGPAGSGKTQSCLAYAATRGMRYYNVSSNIGTEPSQLFGKWNPNADGHFVWQDGAVTDLVRHGGVLLINEVNFLPERVTTVLFALLDKRREIQLLDKDGEVIKAHKDLLIIADCNPNYRGTRQMNEAWRDRFTHSLSFPYDTTIEQKLIKNKTLLTIAAALRDVYDKGEITRPISTRSLVAFEQNMERLGVDYAIYSYLNSFSDETERQAVDLLFGLHKDALSGVVSTNTTVSETVTT